MTSLCFQPGNPVSPLTFVLAQPKTQKTNRRKTVGFADCESSLTQTGFAPAVLQSLQFGVTKVIDGWYTAVVGVCS